jgi:hypothetical protein
MRPALLFVGLCLFAAPQTAEKAAISVCTVLANRLRFNGELISVRGYEESTDEGSWLKGDCKTHITTDGRRWPNLIWLTLSHRDALHEIPFQTNMDALRRFGDRTAAAARSGHKYRVRVTYEGMFETEGDQDIGGSEVGPNHGVGFGA